MKRTLATLICFAILISLAGCGIGSLSSGNAVLPTSPPTVPAQTSAPTLPEQTQPVQTTIPTQPVQTDPFPPTYQIPLTAIAMPQIRQTDTTETGEAVFTYAYPDITFLHQDAEVARTVLLELRNRVEAYRSEAQNLKSQAGSIAEASGRAPDYAMTITCEPMRVDQSILSVLLNQEIRSDTDMGIASIQTVTYDLVTGKPITLSQLLAEDASADTLLSMLSDSLSATEGLYSWYDEILSELFTGNTLPENWYLSAEGLCFYFMPYEVAPYSVEVTIPYNQLHGMIRDRYYPPELPQATGTMEVIPFEAADLSQFTSFAEVVLSPVDNAFLFYPTGVVSQLRIHEAAFSPGADTGSRPAAENCTSGATVFAADILLPGQAVRVQDYSESLFRVMHISYVSNGTFYSAYYFLNLIGLEGYDYLVNINP